MTRFEVPIMISFQSEVTAFFWAAHESISGIMAEIGRFNSEIKRTSALPCWQVGQIFWRDCQKSDLRENHGNFNKNPPKSTKIHKIKWHSNHMMMMVSIDARWFRSTPHPATVTTRIITFLVGNPWKPLFVTVTAWGVDPIDDSWCMFNSIICWEPLAIWPWWRPPSTSFRNRFAHVSLREILERSREAEDHVCSNELTLIHSWVCLCRLSKSTSGHVLFLGLCKAMP